MSIDLHNTSTESQRERIKIEEESKFVPSRDGVAAVVSATGRTRAGAAFDEFLRTRRDHCDGLSAKDQLWTAFEAGADFVMQELTP